MQRLDKWAATGEYALPGGVGQVLVFRYEHNGSWLVDMAQFRLDFGCLEGATGKGIERHEKGRRFDQRLGFGNPVEDPGGSNRIR